MQHKNVALFLLLCPSGLPPASPEAARMTGVLKKEWMSTYWLLSSIGGVFDWVVGTRADADREAATREEHTIVHSSYATRQEAQAAYYQLVPLN
jgi:hypothetical protein